VNKIAVVCAGVRRSIEVNGSSSGCFWCGLSWVFSWLLEFALGPFLSSLAVHRILFVPILIPHSSSFFGETVFAAPLVFLNILRETHLSGLNDPTIFVYSGKSNTMRLFDIRI
jgi:hypothetical protein